MPAYRFCRPDDLPLLVQAWNSCCRPHTPQEPEMTIPEFKRLIRELDLWTSSCMIATAGTEPIAVIFGCKRPAQTLIYRVGVHPQHLRQGHATHLLESLSKKLAVLGPPELVAEIPEAESALQSLFTKSGYSVSLELTDYVLEGTLPELKDAECLGEIGWKDAASLFYPEADAVLAWEHQLSTLKNRESAVRGAGFASPEALEAGLFYSVSEGVCRLLRFVCASSQARNLMFSILVRYVRHKEQCAIYFPKVSSSEIPSDCFDELGFVPAGRFRRFKAQADAG